MNSGVDVRTTVDTTERGTDKRSTRRVLLVDFENVQAVNLCKVPGDVCVWLVLGATQKSMPTQLAISAQALGSRLTYISIGNVAPNAVDFCIAFYLGEVLSREPDTECVILSKDKKGFDPLVRHLVSERGFKVRRVNSQKEAFQAGTKAAVGSGDSYGRALKLLAKEKALPRTRKGLDGKLKCWFAPLSTNERDVLAKRLMQDGHVRETAGALTFHF